MRSSICWDCIIIEKHAGPYFFLVIKIVGIDVWELGRVLEHGRDRRGFGEYLAFLNGCGFVVVLGEAQEGPLQNLEGLEVQNFLFKSLEPFEHFVAIESFLVVDTSQPQYNLFQNLIQLLGLL